MIVPALFVVDALGTLTKAERIVVPGVGLKEGVVDELVAFISETEPYHSDRDHRRRLLLTGPGGVAADEPDEMALIG